MKSKSLFSSVVFFILLIVGLIIAYSFYSALDMAASISIALSSFVIALIISSAIKIADPWDKAVVLRLGKFHSLKGPGLFTIIPIIDSVCPKTLVWMEKFSFEARRLFKNHSLLG